MYIIPGYTDHYNEDNIIYVTSKLFQNTVKLTDPIKQKEFYEIIDAGGCEDLSSPLKQFLHEQELLSNENEIAEALNSAQRLMESSLILTIMPTEGCNFRCPYCYEEHETVKMTDKMIEQIKYFVLKNIHRFDDIKVGWFGGEPTLCKEKVLEISKYIQLLQQKNGFSFASSMTTNGFLLGIDDFKEYYQAGITAYQITIDGWNHDETRPLASGVGTLNTILDNLIKISSLPKDKFKFQIILRHNILNGDEDYSWYDHLNELFGQDERFSVAIRSVNNWGGENVENLDLLVGRKKEELIHDHESYVDKIGLKRERGEELPFGRICYAAYPYSYVFRANGLIEKCTVALNHPSNLIGELDPNEGVMINDMANNLWSQSELTPECYSCKDVLSCFNLQCRRYVVIDGHKACCHRLEKNQEIGKGNR